MHYLVPTVLLLVLATALLAVPGDGRYHLSLRFAEGTAARVPALGPVAATPADDGESDGAAYGGGPLLILERRDGEWAPSLCGEAPDAFGMVRRAEEEGGDWRVTVDVLTGAIPRVRDWLARGNAVDGAYELRFRIADGRITGTFTGNLGGEAVSGQLGGMVSALGGPGLPPVPVGEHPRFLLRTADLPALRAKAQTPWGQAMLARLSEPGWSRSGMAVAEGLQYQLTGDRAHADRARQLFDDDIRSGWWKAIGPIHDPAHKATEAVLAYDLIYETCDPAFHARMRTFLRGMLRHLHDYAEINSGNGHPHSNWSAQYRAATGMVALMLLADPAPLPDLPRDWDFPQVVPPAEFAVKDGMPVLPFGDAPLRKWLYAGPLNIGLEHDGLEALGGAAHAWPTNGTTFITKAKPNPRVDEVSGKFRMAIEFKNARPRPRNYGVKDDDLQPLTAEAQGVFRPIPEKVVLAENEFLEKLGTPGMISAWRAAGLTSFQTLYYFAVLDNPKDQYAQLKLTGANGDWYYHNSAVYTSGQRFVHGDVLFLKAGKHPMLRQMTIGMLCEAHGRNHLYDEVWLRPLDDAAVARARALKNADVRFRRRCIQTLGPGTATDLDGLLWQPIARRAMDLYATNAIGDRGWHCAGQCYTQHPLRVALPFEHAYRTATGAGIAAESHLGWFLAQAVAHTVYAPTWARMQDYGRGGGPVGVDLFGRGYGVVPKDLQPAVLWAWRRTLDLTDRKLFTAPELTVDSLDPVSAAFTFVNMPLPGEGDEANPADSLPRAVFDSQRLGWTLRNRWQDGEDIVALLTGFQHPGGDWACETAKLDWRLQGLGAEWVVRCSSYAGVPNIVHVAGATGESQRITVKHNDLKPDGSGSISLAYGLLPKGGGLRAFAADYSGTCGAPALLVLADRIDFASPVRPTTPPPVWPLTGPPDDDDPPPPLPAPVRPADPPPNQWRLATDLANFVAVLPDGFTITSPDGAVLRATVVEPAKPTIAVAEETHATELNYRFDHTNGTFTRKVVTVAGTDRFLVVMTLSRGPAPTVALNGGRISVGQQVVRFDGEKVIIGRGD